MYGPLGFSLIVLVCLVLWSAGSWYVLRGIEQPDYEVLEVRSGYEIRKYQPYIVAETEVSTADDADALRAGFGLVADYIFGNNQVQEKIAMTSPVLSTESKSEEIAMTTPVLSSDTASGTRMIAFILPSKYTPETLPVPNNPAVNLREVPSHTVAVKRFSWFATSKRIETQKGKLRGLLTEDKVSTVGGFTYAGYNPPLSVPFMRRHEVMVDVEFSN